jgi:hypothetical protein
VNKTSIKRSAAAFAVAASMLGATVGLAAAQEQTPPDQAAWTAPADTEETAATAPTDSEEANVVVPLGSDDEVGQVPTPQPGQRPGRGGDQDGQRQQPTAEQIQQFQQQRDQMQQAYIDDLAKNLNLDSATVKAAIEQTQKDMQAARVTEIQQAVTDGKLTQDQADQMIQRIQNGPQGGGPGMGGPGFGGPGFGGPGRGGPGGPGNGN